MCLFHHKSVHEYRWGLRRDPDGALARFRPDGTPYRPGPGPPPDRPERPGVPSVLVG